jgi:hypothetical protein
VTGPSEESAPGHPEAAEGAKPSENAELFSDDRTDSTPHPNSGAYDVPPTQVVASPNPAVSGPYPVPGAQQQAYYS